MLFCKIKKNQIINMIFHNTFYKHEDEIYNYVMSKTFI